jgi:signal transduction histidine kinase
MTDVERRLEELRAAVATRDEVLAVVAHDLRGPLNILAMGLEILRHAGPAGQESNIDRMRRALETMSDLVTNLVDLSHIREGRTTLNPTTLYPEILVRDVVSSQAHQLARRGLTLKHAAAGGLPPVSADYERMLRVFSDLVGHAARKANPGSTIRIEAGPEGNGSAAATGPEGPRVAFRVVHEGAPVRQDDLGMDVDAYFRLPSSERRVSDLGLAIARAIIEAHGGRVVAPTDPAGEPVIRFWLPSPGGG